MATFPLGLAASPSVGRSVADIHVGSRSQGEGSHIPARSLGFAKQGRFVFAQLPRAYMEVLAVCLRNSVLACGSEQ
jgi:hypothetical protein